MSMCKSLKVKYNPFPRNPIPDPEDLVLYDPHNYLYTLHSVVNYTLSTGKSNHAVIIGPYGSGKTHLLLCLLRKLKGLKGVISVYIPTPSDNFFTIYSNIVKSIPLKEIIAASDSLPPDIARKIKMLENSDYSEYILSWLYGEKISSNIRYKLSLGRNLDEYMAIAILGSILKVIDKTLVILLDELEHLVEIPIQVRQRYASLLRYMIDSIPRKFCIIASATPAGWNEILENYIALARRLSGTVIYLHNISLKHAYELVDVYLAKYGIAHDDLFCEKAIKEAYIASQGNIGDFLKIMAAAVEYATEKGIDKVDAEIVKEVLRYYS